MKPLIGKAMRLLARLNPFEIRAGLKPHRQKTPTTTSTYQGCYGNFAWRWRCLCRHPPAQAPCGLKRKRQCRGWGGHLFLPVLVIVQWPIAGGGERLPGRRKAEAARAGDVVADDVLAHETITFIAGCAAALSNYKASAQQALAS